MLEQRVGDMGKDIQTEQADIRRIMQQCTKMNRANELEIRRLEEEREKQEEINQKNQ